MNESGCLNAQGYRKEMKTIPPIRLGSAFDLSFDMTSEFPLTASKTHSDQFELDLSRTTLPTSQRSASKTSRNEKTSGFSLISGSNSPTVHRIDASGTTANVANQAPITMNRMALLDTEPALNYSTRSFSTARSPRASVKTYVFAFKEEAQYIPKPFVSSHKPKAARQRPMSARVSDPRRIKRDMPAKLSKKRNIYMEPTSNLIHSVMLGSFEDLTNKYQGP